MPLPFTTAATPVIGMLHAPPLPGSPRFPAGGDFAAVRGHVLRDAEALADGGVHAMMLENFGDAPFFPGRVPPETIACMTALACEVTRQFDLPLGVNVLRNDGCAAMAVAVAAGARFIRVNILGGARVTDQGVIQGIAHDLMRMRATLGAEGVTVLADVDVKHSAALADRPIADEVADVIHRGGADAVIVSGRATGRPAELDRLRAVKAAAGDRPVLVGSGVSAESIAALRHEADGFIVGTSVKRAGRVHEPVDPDRVRDLMGRLS